MPLTYKARENGTYNLVVLVETKHKKTETESKVLDSRQVWSFNSATIVSRVVSVLDSGAEGPGFKSQTLRCPVTVSGKLFTPIVPLFIKQRNWSVSYTHLTLPTTPYV